MDHGINGGTATSPCAMPALDKLLTIQGHGVRETLTAAVVHDPLRVRPRHSE